jgi:D-glycero-alpha-D-manno-heptose-7-phosphate kinase
LCNPDSQHIEVDYQAEIVKYENTIKELEKWLVLIYTNQSRRASDVVSEQLKLMNNKKESYQELIDLAKLGHQEIINKNFREMADILTTSWNVKKQLSNNITNKGIDDLIIKISNNGALGYKLLGAGSGGFVLAVVDPSNKKDFCENFKKTGCIDNISFVPNGVSHTRQF